jgi:hypothetical protein
MGKGNSTAEFLERAEVRRQGAATDCDISLPGVRSAEIIRAGDLIRVAADERPRLASNAIFGLAKMIARMALLTVLCCWLSSARAWCAEQLGSKPDADTLHCVAVETPRLPSGESFTAAIGKELEFRLRAEPRGRWIITLGPTGAMRDYIGIVSPPFETAPHLLIGAGYETAKESVMRSPRRFQFVTTPQEYEDAVAFVEHARRDREARITAREIEQKGKGSLELWITEFGMSPAEDTLSWVIVRVKACQPR